MFDSNCVDRNTGHDFGGRNLGAGSLSIWTHNLKSYELIPNYTKGQYTGMAVHHGAGAEAWEVYNYALDNNITLVAAGGRTVGAAGGWFALGGHGNLASSHGLGSDQALEIHVVTPDGRFGVASPDENEDLFYALRGGGGSE
jgi:FAD/FMN-containing dehydrogenase